MNGFVENKNLKNEWKNVQLLFKNKKMNFALQDNEESHRATYENLTYLLAKIYVRANWGKIAKSWKIRSEDVFQHKIKVGARKANIPQIIDKLSNLLGLQSIAILSDVIDKLQEDEIKTLGILRRESIYITRKAIELSIFLKDINNLK